MQTFDRVVSQPFSCFVGSNSYSFESVPTKRQVLEMTDLGVAVTVLLGQPKNERELPQIQEGRTQKNRKKLDEIVTEAFASQSLAMHGYSQQMQLSVEKHPGYFFDFLSSSLQGLFPYGAWGMACRGWGTPPRFSC